MSQLGRISGPLLADNLLRNGSDLAFETNLLYLDVNSRKLGLRTNGPTHDVSVNGTTGTSHLIVDNDSFLANLEVTGHQIQNVIGNIVISPNQSSNPTVVAPILKTDGFEITSDYIANNITNGNISLNISGRLIVNSDTLVNGSLHATGDITFEGNLTLGNQSSDTIDFQAEVGSNVIPSTDNTYNLGGSNDIWKNVYVQNLTIDQQVNLDTSSLTTLRAGNFTFTSNNITVPVNNNINLVPTGTGQLNLNSGDLTVKIIGNTWTPDPTVDIFQFNSVGEGIWDLSQSPVSFPVGDNSQRPVAPPTGTIRYNTQLGYEEVYNGQAWQPAIGLGGAIPKATVDDIMQIWSLILG